MKRILACLLALVMCVCVLAACTTEPADNNVETESGLTLAKEYLKTMYEDATEATPADYKVVGVVNIDGVVYSITWTADSDTVKIIPGDDKMVTIDVDEANPEEVVYVLTATLSDAEGNTEVVTFTHRTPAAIIIEEGMSYAEIVDIAYGIEDGLALEDTFRLYGTVTNIDTAWSEDYQNITVTIVVDGKEDKPIMCYRLKGDGAKDLAVGDKITVEGLFKNYKGTIEFDAGCVLVGYGEHKDQTALLDAAYSLEDGLAMTEPSTLSGTITKIDTAWSEDYQNITVTMDCGDPERLIMCYRLKGEGAKDLAVGDYITVTGTIKNYKGTIEFDAGCTLDAVVKAAASDEAVEDNVEVVEAPSDPLEIVNALYALADGEELPYTATLVGTVTSIDTEYSEQYGNVTVTIAVAGAEDKPIQCFRLKGDDAATVTVGDVIVVTGGFKNYGGTYEMVNATFVTVPTDAIEIVNACYALEDGASLPYEAVLTGTIISIDSEYSEQYGNITVTITVEGAEDKPIQCFRLKGEGAADLAVGDVIVVKGTLKNYKGTYEFDAGCTLG